jgi:hypothetical protein
VGEVQRDPTTAPAVVAPDYARMGKAVSQLEEFAAGNLHGEVCEGGDSGESQYRISSNRRAPTGAHCAFNENNESWLRARRQRDVITTRRHLFDNATRAFDAGATLSIDLLVP